MKPSATTILCFVVVFFLIGITQATPTTNPATLIGNNNFTLSATGCVAAGCWFEYGITPDSLMVWTVTNAPVAGTVTTTESNSPIEPSMNYYAAACDTTGCGNIVTFNTTPSTPLAVSTLGAMVDNITRSKGNILFLATNIWVPYTWLFPANAASTAISIVVGVMLFFVYWGFWRRGRSIIGPVIIGLLTAPLFLYANTGMHLGIPPEFQAIAQALLYASIAGLFLSFLKR